MRKIFNFIKKYWLLILISITAILVIINSFIPKPPEVVPTPRTDKIATYKTITPGASTREDVNELLGTPLKETKLDGKTLSEYKTVNQFINHQIITENDIVGLVKEAINIEDNKNSDVVTSIYGPAPYILYEQVPESVFNLYVYPQNGIAYLGHEDGTILEVWYFSPTSLENFISNWAPNYSTREFTGRPTY